MDAADRERLLASLREVVGERYAFADPYEMRLYQYDASPETALPDIVVLPGTSEEVARIVKICGEAKVPVTPRSAASSLAGGTVPVQGGVVITFARMDRILEIDTENLRAVVQPGVVNLALSQALKPHGYYYVPDPSSQGACTIGGNVATNAGPAHAPLRRHRQPRHRSRGCARQRRSDPGRWAQRRGGDRLRPDRCAGGIGRNDGRRHPDLGEDPTPAAGTKDLDGRLPGRCHREQRRVRHRAYRDPAGRDRDDG